MSHSDKYNLFTKEKSLTLDSLPSLIISCGYLPNDDLFKIVTEIKQKNEEENTETISMDEFLQILERCTKLKGADELLQHILFFTNKEMVIKKDQFEKMINIKSKDSDLGLTQNELNSLYEIMNVQDDKVNLEEFVKCIVDE